MGEGSEQGQLDSGIGFDEANKIDEMESKYFSPETNIGYELTFKSWKLYRKMVPDFNDKSTLVEKTILELIVDSVNGQKPKNGTQEWGILSMKQRQAFEPYCRNENITKKVFQYKHKGEAKNRTYQISEVRDKPASI